MLFPHVRKQLTSKMQEDHQLVITDRNNRIQAIQYENVDLQGVLRNISQTVKDLIENSHVAKLVNMIMYFLCLEEIKKINQAKLKNTLITW